MADGVDRLKRGALEAALESARNEGRSRDAAMLAYKLDRKAEAADLFEQSGEYIDAAQAYQDLGNLQRALTSVLRTPAEDARYASAARLAIELAASLNAIGHSLEEFLAPYLTRSPDEAEDVAAFFALAQLYESNDYSAYAIDLYRRIVRVHPRHEAGIRLRNVQASAEKSATMDMVVSKEDVRAIRELVRAAPAPVRKEPRLGDRLGARYRLDATLGSGATAKVFRARDLKLNEDVALKLVEPFPKGGTEETRFRREVSLARRLAHPNVVRIYDLGEHDERLFLTMELLDGADLRKHSEENVLGDAEKLALLLQACDGLGYAHTNLVVHRDVKPENMFVTRAGVLKIADFGMAKAPGDISVTMTGAIGGTPYYMSPEQITDFRRADHRADLYALGVIAYELFTGRVPFDAESLPALLSAHLAKPPAPMRSLRPELSKELDAVVLKLLAKAREARFQSCAELAAALRKISF